MTDLKSCPSCGSERLTDFHEQRGVPVNSCLLVDDEASARTFPRGDLRLAFCERCGFITNRAFDPSRTEYSGRYEETQGFSPRFQTFMHDLVDQWIDAYDIHGKHVLEIGCGKGEFLELMCKRGGNRGTGIDPSFIEERRDRTAEVTFIRDFYGPRYADLAADVVVCRHTLEHIQPVRDFVAQVRATIGDRTDTVVLFELPDVLRVLEEVAFWDVYYEHCSYFSQGSLAGLFRSTGFDVLNTSLAYDDQYILLEARPASEWTGLASTGSDEAQVADDMNVLRAGVASFSDRFSRRCAAVTARVRRAAGDGKAGVIWGAGSKAVSLLTTLDIGDAITAAVDVNPFKQGRFVPGTGHVILGPEAMKDVKPSTVFAMNSIYCDEITQQLSRLDLYPEVVGL